MKLRRYLVSTLAVLLLGQVTLLADVFDLTWFTVDGGGATFSTGGGFVLGGTIGQPDAGSNASPMTGGTFELVGGFWPVTNVCYCLGDLTHDGVKDARDVQKFTDCLLAAANCSCADVDAANGVTLDDAAVFVNDLLAGTTCP